MFRIWSSVVIIFLKQLLNLFLRVTCCVVPASTMSYLMFRRCSWWIVQLVTDWGWQCCSW